MGKKFENLGRNVQNLTYLEKGQGIACNHRPQ